VSRFRYRITRVPGPSGSEDPLVWLIVTGAQSPAVMLILALGIVAGA